MKNTLELVTSSPIFGIMVTLIAFEIGLYLSKRLKNPLVNPILVAITILILFLKSTNIPYETYNIGGSYITFLLLPATVVLAVPLYKNFQLLKKNAIPILVGVFSGCIVNVLGLVLIAKIIKLNPELLLSLLPKSVTTPIGIEISKQIGGIPQLTVACIVLTGITGVICGPTLFKLLRVDNKVAQGVAYGTASHALGTSKAIEVGEIEGGMSGLSIGIAGLITVIIVPTIIGIVFS